MQALDTTFEPDILDAFRDVPTAVISDNLQRLPGFFGLKPYHRSGRLIGRARTVRTRAGDNLTIHKMLDLVKPGEVIVVAGEGDTSRALVGDIMKNIAESRGVAGFVIDGAIRDCAAFAASDFPCFAKAVTHRGPYKDGPGEIDVPIAIEGTVVSPGDIVVGDADGVVTFSIAVAKELAAAVHAQIAREEAIINSIHAGTYTGAYAKK
ncbi:RraA family protein [Bradyrhizobium sp. HKCCYLS2038]|uniref:RraA family protein n=1 Tax=unclassified Bradyrhizobium TaxID=2631580 RepID=UPI003EB9EBA4